MIAIANALRRALPLLFTARIIALATLPLLVAAVVWIAIAVMAWNPVTEAIARFFSAAEPGAWQRFAADAIAALMFVALAVVTALTAIAVLTMPVIVKIVAAQHFPTLEAKRGGTLAGSIRNASVALTAFVVLWLLALPLLVLPPVYVVASLLLNAWLSQRMFRYDALAEHASEQETASILRDNRSRLFGLGVVLSPLSLVPIVNVLVLPIYAGIAFTELCLSELARLRARAERTPSG